MTVVLLGICHHHVIVSGPKQTVMRLKSYQNKLKSLNEQNSGGGKKQPMLCKLLSSSVKKNNLIKMVICDDW